MLFVESLVEQLEQTILHSHEWVGSKSVIIIIQATCILIYTCMLELLPKQPSSTFTLELRVSMDDGSRFPWKNKSACECGVHFIFFMHICHNRGDQHKV